MKRFVLGLCKVVNMKPFGKPQIKRFGKGELGGYSCIQFIETSTITIHLDESGRRVFIDIFSCRKFDVVKVTSFCKKYFRAKKASAKTLERK